MMSAAVEPGRSLLPLLIQNVILPIFYGGYGSGCISMPHLPLRREDGRGLAAAGVVAWRCATFDGHTV